MGRLLPRSDQSSSWGWGWWWWPAGSCGGSLSLFAGFTLGQTLSASTPSFLPALADSVFLSCHFSLSFSPHLFTLLSLCGSLSLDFCLLCVDLSDALVDTQVAGAWPDVCFAPPPHRPPVPPADSSRMSPPYGTSSHGEGENVVPLWPQICVLGVKIPVRCSQAPLSS